MDENLRYTVLMTVAVGDIVDGQAEAFQMEMQRALAKLPAVDIPANAATTSSVNMFTGALEVRIVGCRDEQMSLIKLAQYCQSIARLVFSASRMRIHADGINQVAVATFIGATQDNYEKARFIYDDALPQHVVFEYVAEPNWFTKALMGQDEEPDEDVQRMIQEMPS